MKQKYNLLSLAIAFTGLIIFWMIPAMHTAAPVAYYRLYENTDLKKETSPAGDTAIKAVNRKKEKPEKAYRKEKISKEQKIKQVHPKMFSRSMQYMREEELLLVVDSLEQNMQVTIEADSADQFTKK